MTERGELAIVLHTHMPYVEGFGTWPFGEEWLWEAMATSYLPLLDVLAREPGITLSLTPVLCDQLEAPGVAARFEAFITGVRRDSHRRDIEGLRASGATDLAEELVRAAADYERALERFTAIGGDMLGALCERADWTSSATHAVLPLCATDAGARLQIEAGIAAHRARCGRWQGGFWLPECAYAPWLQPLLAQAGVRACCVELTGLYGSGAPEHLRPLHAGYGPLLVPIDRQTIELVWSDDGYPSHPLYRDYHRHTYHHHRPWAIGGEPYDHAAACAQARAHAAEFVIGAQERLRSGGLLVCALDTELLGHWWYEGVVWLEAVVDEAAARGLPLVGLDAALERHPPVEIDELPGPSTWGASGDLSTWDGPAVAELAFAARDFELRTAGSRGRGSVAARELAALQSSDWAFMATRELAADYPTQRAAGHREALERALADPSCSPNGLRNIAPYASTALLDRP